MLTGEVPVVGAEDEDRVSELPRRLQGVEEPVDQPVDVQDVRMVGGDDVPKSETDWSAL